MKRLGVGGGVAANSRMRQKLGEMAAGLGVELFIPPAALCTDNAAMAGIALPKLAAGQVASLDVDVTAGLVAPGTTTLLNQSFFRPQPGRRSRDRGVSPARVGLAIRPLLRIELLPPLERLLVDRLSRS